VRTRSARIMLAAALAVVSLTANAADPTKEQLDAARRVLEKSDGYVLEDPYFEESRPVAKFGFRINLAKVTPEFLKTLPDVSFPHGLIFNDRKFTGEGLSLLKGRKNLVAVYISNTALTDAGVKELAEIDTLEQVYLWYSPKLTNASVESLAGLKGLKALNIGGSQVNDDGLKVLGGMTQLEQLWASHLPVTDAGLKPLAKLTGLKALNLMENQKLTPDAVASLLRALKSLERLELEYVPTTDAVMKEIGRHTKLRHLSLFSADKVTDDGVKELAGLTDMTYLSVVGCKLTDKGLKHLLGMSKLERLHVYGSQLTDAAVPDLVTFKSLKHVWLNNGISKSGKDALTKGLPKCTLQ